MMVGSIVEIVLTRVLVTGASGLIGRALSNALKNQSEDIFTLTSADVDLRDSYSTLEKFLSVKPDVVYHLAAKVAGLGGNLSNPYGMYFDNIMINTNVIEAARRCGVGKIVAAGTAACYSDSVSLPMRETDIWNGPPHKSERPYGHAKRAMLAQLEALNEAEGTQFSYAILTNTYGPHDVFDTVHGHVMPTLLMKVYDALKNKADLNVWGNGTAQRDFLHVNDVAQALVLLARTPLNAVNVASGTLISIKDLVNLIVEITEFSGNVIWDASKPDGQLQRSYDLSKLESLGFKTSLTLSAGISETFQWLSSNISNVRTGNFK